MTLLAPYECHRAASIRDLAAQRAYVAAHVLVREVAAQLLDLSPSRLTLVQRCETCGGDHGRPSLADHPHVFVSLSHSRHVVAAAASDAPVGIDVEDLHGMRYDALRRSVVFSSQEIAAIDALAPDKRDEAAARLWVRKECTIKLGLTSLDDPSDHASAAAAAGCVFSDWRHDSLAVVGAVASRIPTALRLLA